MLASPPSHTEAAFETVIESHLLASGYVAVDRNAFDQERGIFPANVLEFIRETQSKEWAKLEALHGAKTGEQVLIDLCKWMDTYGSLATLRHGFKCYGRTLRVAFFKAAHELNPELEERYAANRVGVTRQLHFSPRAESSLDVTISLNGVPVITAELKNPLTGQTVENARWQYRHDRDPREVIFAFKRRTLVHFAIDTETVFMTTRLAGTATHFLPFNRGCNGGAGNSPDPAGKTYRTGYLWEEVLQRDSLLDLLARFVHLQEEEKRDDQGRKVKKETMIFPRYHQLQAVRALVDAARQEGVGHNYLVEHSAGSGKSNTCLLYTSRSGLCGRPLSYQSICRRSNPVFEGSVVFEASTLSRGILRNLDASTALTRTARHRCPHCRRDGEAGCTAGCSGAHSWTAEGTPLRHHRCRRDWATEDPGGCVNIKRLQVANLRAFEQATFEFNPRMTLLVGINGVGKTTVLDAVRLCLSKILPATTASRSRGLPFTDEDIRGTAPALTVQLEFSLGGKEFEFLVHKQREASVAHKRGVVREQTMGTPDTEKCTPDLSVLGESTKTCLLYTSRCV